MRLVNGSARRSRWEWTTSNSPARADTSAIISRCRWGATSLISSALKRSRRGFSKATSRASVEEVAGPNRVTSCPCATSSSHSVAMTRSVPPYAPGGTAS